MKFFIQRSEFAKLKKLNEKKKKRKKTNRMSKRIKA